MKEAENDETSLQLPIYPVSERNLSVLSPEPNLINKSTSVLLSAETAVPPSNRKRDIHEPQGRFPKILNDRLTMRFLTLTTHRHWGRPRAGAGNSIVPLLYFQIKECAQAENVVMPPLYPPQSRKARNCNLLQLPTPPDN